MSAKFQNIFLSSCIKLRIQRSGNAIKDLLLLGNDVPYFQAKLAARRARRLAESQRKMEEEEAQRVVAEQRKQMQQQGGANGSGSGSETVQSQDTGLLVAPKMSYGESTEEQALKKEQVTKLRLKIY